MRTGSTVDSTLRVLVAHGLVDVPAQAHAVPSEAQPAAAASLMTVAANVAHYGFALSAEAFAALRALDDEPLVDWWQRVEPVLAERTGADRNIAEFVVYKNFPAEVLAMDQVEYWTRQLLMYWGLPNEFVTQPAQPRPDSTDVPRFRVLHLADDGSLAAILAELLALPARWTDEQFAEVTHVTAGHPGPVELALIPFVENRIRLAALLCERGQDARVATATDVLRLAVAMSGGDVSLRTRTRLRAWRRRERRFLLGMLESAESLQEDLARRPERFKRLLRGLHPGDYRVGHPRVVAAYDKLYRGAPVPTFASEVERMLGAAEPAALELLSTRPGEFARRVHTTVLRYGADAVHAFAAVVPSLTTTQLLRLDRYLWVAPMRSWRVFPPRGAWSRVQVVPADPARHLPPSLSEELRAAIGAELARRLADVGPVALDPAVEDVRLQTNDNELTPYGRGTVFRLPADVDFVRTASYWSSGPTSRNIWYDNGWNFFDERWQPVGACCWTDVAFGTGALFSGDPTNTKDVEGRACQLIDLNLDDLVRQGVTFALWSLLCYSRIPFSGADEVYAALQWGADAQTGGLFEPSRCQLSFPVRGSGLTKFVAYLDLRRRELVYLDANLPARTHSANDNGSSLERLMPAFVEYLDGLPSVYDLFRHAPSTVDGMPVVYDDTEVSIDGGPAYVFRPTNPENRFERFDLGALL